LKKTNIGCY